MQSLPVFLDSLWVGLGFRVQGSRVLRGVFELITAKGLDFRLGAYGLASTAGFRAQGLGV